MNCGMRRALTWMILAAGAMGAWPASGVADSAVQPYFIGVNYGPFHQEGQSPHAAAELPAEQMRRDLGIMHAAGFRHIRTFGLDNGLSRIPPLAQRHYPDLRLFLGVYACARDHDDLRNPHSTRSQLEEALRLAEAHPNVAGIVVGNECLPGEPEACPRPVSVEQLIEDLAYVKRRLVSGRRPGVVVTTAMSMVAAVANYETQGKRLAPHVDVLMVNIHPFFAPAAVEEAVSANFHGSYHRLQQLYAHLGKPLVVGESGWPSAGPPNGAAVPGLENQRRFIEDLARYVRTRTVSVFLFEMFDEPWKDEMGGIGPHWGLFDRQGRAKFPLPDWSRIRP
jgi:glucan 1,3-beta-glucosidase